MENQTSSGFWEGTEVIYAYTRAQAIADGVLVNLMQGEMADLVREAGFRFPIAMTVEAFGDYVVLTPKAKEAGNDLKGRLWDVLYMLKMAIRKQQGSASEITFQFRCVTDRIKPKLCTLKAVCGPGDQGEPVITIMHPWQD